jgi:molybdopterin synthase sulfur carrier subunit
MIRIKVKLFAGLRPHLPPQDRPGPAELELAEPASVAEVLAALAIPFPEAKIILVNGRHAKPGTGLKEGDLVAIFPPVGGG